MKKLYRPIVLVVLDGWGEWNVMIGNPLTVAKLPTIDMLNKHYPKLLLDASGMSVGLPWGVMGNSEVGHQTMGVGQIIFEDLPTIDMAIQTGSFYKNEVLREAMATVKQNNSNLHIWGLVSDGAVHSRLKHLYALLQMAKLMGLNQVYIHAITDGRDTPPNSGRQYIEELLVNTKKIGAGRLATVIGRYYAMDRNKNWDRIEKAFLALTECQGILDVDPVKAIAKQYKNNVFDEYLEPIVVVDETNKPVGRIKDNDTIICFNYRGDRARQLTRAFTVPGFSEFKQASIPAGISYYGFTFYEKDLPIKIAFPSKKITTRLGEILANYGKHQLRIAETEKYAHVTYFFNGGSESPFKDEERILVPSKNAPSYANAPEMSAREITDKLAAAINNKQQDFVLVNYANADMVGHTGDFQAGIIAVETVDSCLADLIKAILKENGCLVITADHGNIEEMVNVQTGEIDTKHSTNPVPCWLVAPDNQRHQPLPAAMLPTEVEGMIVDIPPTILDLFHLDKPSEMSGRSLLPIFNLK